MLPISLNGGNGLVQASGVWPCAAEPASRMATTQPTTVMTLERSERMRITPPGGASDRARLGYDPCFRQQFEGTLALVGEERKQHVNPVHLQEHRQLADDGLSQTDRGARFA